MSICKSCQRSVDNGGSCLKMLASDGHYTWLTPVDQELLDEYFYQICDSLFSPKDECVRFQARSCQCGSNVEWVKCAENSAYCG